MPTTTMDLMSQALQGQLRRQTLPARSLLSGQRGQWVRSSPVRPVRVITPKPEQKTEHLAQPAPIKSSSVMDSIAAAMRQASRSAADSPVASTAAGAAAGALGGSVLQYLRGKKILPGAAIGAGVGGLGGYALSRLAPMSTSTSTSRSRQTTGAGSGSTGSEPAPTQTQPTPPVDVRAAVRLGSNIFAAGNAEAREKRYFAAADRAEASADSRLDSVDTAGKLGAGVGTIAGLAGVATAVPGVVGRVGTAVSRKIGPLASFVSGVQAASDQWGLGKVLTDAKAEYAAAVQAGVPEAVAKKDFIARTANTFLPVAPDHGTGLNLATAATAVTAPAVRYSAVVDALSRANNIVHAFRQQKALGNRSALSAAWKDDSMERSLANSLANTRGALPAFNAVLSNPITLSSPTTAALLQQQAGKNLERAYNTVVPGVEDAEGKVHTEPPASYKRQTGVGWVDRVDWDATPYKSKQNFLREVKQVANTDMDAAMRMLYGYVRTQTPEKTGKWWNPFGYAVDALAGDNKYGDEGMMDNAAVKQRMAEYLRRAG